MGLATGPLAVIWHGGQTEMDGESDNGTTYRADMPGTEPGEPRSTHVS